MFRGSRIAAAAVLLALSLYIEAARAVDLSVCNQAAIYGSSIPAGKKFSFYPSPQIQPFYQW